MLSQTKHSQHSKSFLYLWVLMDAFCLLSSYHFTNAVLGKDFTGTFPDKSFLYIMTLSWSAAMLYYMPHSKKYFINVKHIIIGLKKCSIMHLILLFSAFILIYTNSIKGFINIAIIHSIFLVLCFMFRVLQLWVYRYLKNLNKYQTRFIIIGNTLDGQSLFHNLMKANYPGFVFLGYFDEFSHGFLTISKLKEISAFCKAHNVNQIFYTHSSDSQFYHQLLKYANENYIHFASFQVEHLPFNALVDTTLYGNHSSEINFLDAKAS